MTKKWPKNAGALIILPAKIMLARGYRVGNARRMTVPANCAHDNSVSRTPPEEVVLSTRAAEVGSGH
jgi:hypothetical protein